MKKEIKLSRKTFIFLLSTCVLSVLYTLNFVQQVLATERPPLDKYSFLKTFTDVLALVEKNYVEPVDVEELTEGAIKGMLATLDPHTGYLDKDIYKELQVETKGQFGGLGIEITVKDGLLTVVAPIEDSPAFRAGVEPGDKIIKIADEFTKDLSLIDAVKKMRGPKGSPIMISVQRQGVKDLLPITVIRDIIKVKSVRSRLLDEGYGYIRLAQFQEGSAAEFVEAFKSLTSQAPGNKVRGLVMDLRNNPGGLLNQAIRVSDIFLKDGVIVYTEGRLESQRQKYYAHDDSTEPDFPMIVLVNEGSASASEIVAGALQDSGRALILGQQTFGKGSVQTILPMDDGDALRLTTALYFTKSGRSIQAQGITPDIVVSDKRFPKDSEEVLEEDENGEGPPPVKERDLPGAIKNPKVKDGGKGATPAAGAPALTPEEAKKQEEDRVRPGSRNAMTIELPKLLKDDPQLDEALRLLKTWNVFQGKPALLQARDAEKNGA